MDVIFYLLVFRLVDVAEILVIAFTVSVFRKKFFDVFANKLFHVPRRFFREVVFYKIRENGGDEVVFSNLVGPRIR